MHSRISEETAFHVVGIGARASNAREMAGEGTIAKLWERFFQGNVLDRIPHKANGAIVALYTDYASDQDGEYTLVVGARVATAGGAQPGMVAKTIPAGRYAVFTSPRGPLDKVVLETWEQIWSLPKSEPGGDRAFVADFEVYDERAANPQNAQMDVYVRIR